MNSKSKIKLLPSEGNTKVFVKARRECDECGELATNKNTYLVRNARNNPASSAYREDDCSWCSDYDQFLCDNCQPKKHSFTLPDDFKWCSTFTIERFEHMFLFWRVQI